jgi:hypothetical protein
MPTYTDSTPLDWSALRLDRPFTALDYNSQDLAYLQYMADRLRQVLSQPEAIPVQPRPWVLYFEEASARYHRLVLAKPEALLHCNALVVVGFCGNKWPEAERDPLDVVDRELLAEFAQHPHLLSYSSLQIEDGNWRNLVLFSQPQGIGHWAISHKHAQAVRELAPAYYRHIRLHNGEWPGGLNSNHPLRLIRTKYYDYQDKPPWCAVREL